MIHMALATVLGFPVSLLSMRTTTPTEDPIRGAGLPRPSGIGRHCGDSFGGL